MLLLPFTVFIVTTVSLLTMWAAQQYVERKAIYGDFIGLQHTLNDGIAFGISLPSPWLERVVFAAIIAILLFAYAERQSSSKTFAYGLIVGGAISNFIDRAIDGYVTDIFQVGTFPVFNTADTAITIGVMLLLFEIFLDR